MHSFIKKLLLILAFSFIEMAHLQAQPGTYRLTPMEPMHGISGNNGLISKKVNVPPKFYGLFDTSRTLNLPDAYEAYLFHMGGLTKPRVLELDENGVLHVIDFTSNGAIYALPDTNFDNVADQMKVVLNGVNAHCFKFYKEHIYVAEQTRILKCSDLDKDGFYETKEVLIENLGTPAPSGGHTTRTMVIDDKKQKIYVSIGSQCNVCREDYRAVIEEYNIDGSGKRIIATGARNSVGLAIHPYSGKLWANNNGSDRQGNDVPPEWIDWVHDSGYYGYPFAYGHQNWFNFDAHSDYTALKPITAADSAKVSKMHHPAALIQAHSAPMELEWLGLSVLGEPQGGFITALRGSWNRTPATGFKLIFLRQTGNDHQQDSITSYADFMTGFLTDSVSRTYWGRPVGLAIQSRHLRSSDIYVSSDEGNKFILKLVGNHAWVGISEQTQEKWNVYPNPFTQKISFKEPLYVGSNLSITDAMGKEISQQNASGISELDLSFLPNGIYFLRVDSPKGGMHSIIQKIND
ncbi:MAG: T9SS type A sorting domain-containing protein [Bacteroidia bacterium]|nr:T9SS type A sorting domain-containing protein [Bacteroidia bacterium]